jgi:hypothetical protein
MTFSQNFSRTLVLPLIVIMLLAGAGCKSKKKAMEAAAAAEKARIEQEAALKKARDEEERKKQEEAAELDRQRKEKEAQASEPYAKLNDYFNAIAGSATSSSANGTIQEALGMFASEDTPVLIVISESGGNKDYDRPTTIRAYMNYLKDVKKNTNRIGKLHFDNANKIVEVELIKGR